MIETKVVIQLSGNLVGNVREIQSKHIIGDGWCNGSTQTRIGCNVGSNPTPSADKEIKMEVIIVSLIFTAIFVSPLMFDNARDAFVCIVISLSAIAFISFIIFLSNPITTTEINLGMPSFIKDQVIIYNQKSFIVVKETTKRNHFISKNVKYKFYENKPEVSSATFIMEFSR